VRDTMPTFMQMFIARGRNQVGGKMKNVGDHLGRARETGEHAITFSSPMAVVTDIVGRLEGLRGHFEGAPTADAKPSAAASGSSTSSSSHATTAPAAPTTTKWERDTASSSAEVTPTATGPLRSSRADASGLAIPDYDELSASQVVERLDGLSTAELAAIRAYEESTRGRRTILGRIDALSA